MQLSFIQDPHRVFVVGVKSSYRVTSRDGWRHIHVSCHVSLKHNNVTDYRLYGLSRHGHGACSHVTSRHVSLKRLQTVFTKFTSRV